VHADKEPEPLNLGVPVVNFPRANAILARAQALLWLRDCAMPCCIFNVFTVLISLLDNLFKKFTSMFLARVYFFGAKVGTSFSRQNVTISKNKKHTIFRNVKFYPVRNFRDIPN
jgi:hypothetical protein